MTGSGPAPRLMTEVTEPHAHRARRGSNWDLAGHDGAARRCTKRYRRAVRRLCRCGLDRDHDLGSGRGWSPGATRRSSMIHHHRSMQALGTIGPHPAAHRPRVWRETLWAREVWGPHRLSGHTGRERGVSPWEEAPRSCASVQDSERTYASTHVYLGTSRPGPAAPPRARKRTVGCERAGGAARLGAGATAATRRVVDACTSRHHRAGTGRETIWPREVWGQ
jgi:hypothetical protein